MVTGQHASCAATGTAVTAANGVQTRRASNAVKGGPSTTMPVVARTDSAKANERAYQGSTTSIPATARAMSGTPRTGLPTRCTTHTTTAITVARTIDGSGRTRTTNASRNAIATPARADLGSPTERPTTITIPTMTAQLAPETAVRWVSADVSIAASVAVSNPPRSPMARPRRSAAPGSGRCSVAVTNDDRIPPVAASNPVGGTATGSSRRNTTNDVGEPGSSGSTTARPLRAVPAGRVWSGTSPKAGTTRTGTWSPPAPAARRSVPVAERSPGVRSRSSPTSTETARVGRSSSGSGSRCSEPTATATETRAPSVLVVTSRLDVTGTHPRLVVCRARRATSATNPPTASEDVASTTDTAAEGTPTSTAARAQTAATGPARRRSARSGASCRLTRAPGRAVPRTWRHRCR